jgi:hypothetical protein
LTLSGAGNYGRLQARIAAVPIGAFSARVRIYPNLEKRAIVL